MQMLSINLKYSCENDLGFQIFIKYANSDTNCFLHLNQHMFILNVYFYDLHYLHLDVICDFSLYSKMLQLNLTLLT